MSIDFSGINSDKIDKLVVRIIVLRTTLRICFAVIGLGFPLMIGLPTFLVVQSFSTAAKIDRLDDQITAARGDYSRLTERVDRLERTGRP